MGGSIGKHPFRSFQVGVGIDFMPMGGIEEDRVEGEGALGDHLGEHRLVILIDPVFRDEPV